MECSLILWRTFPFALLWSIWKERNNRIFKGASSMQDLISMVFLRVAKWASIRKEFFNINVNDILFNYEECMSCGSRRRRREVYWLAPQSVR